VHFKLERGWRFWSFSWPWWRLASEEKDMTSAQSTLIASETPAKLADENETVSQEDFLTKVSLILPQSQLS